MDDGGVRVNGSDESWAAQLVEDLLKTWVVWEGQAAGKGGRGGWGG